MSAATFLLGFAMGIATAVVIGIALVCCLASRLQSNGGRE